MTYKDLIAAALTAMDHAYAPYSECHVGAALLCRDGTVYTGSNLENASFGATLCAERAAFAKAVSDGEKDFSAIAVVGGKKGKVTDFFPPCGICRQVMREFCRDDFRILLFNGSKAVFYTLAELLPQSFSAKSM